MRSVLCYPSPEKWWLEEFRLSYWGPVTFLRGKLAVKLREGIWTETWFKIFIESQPLSWLETPTVLHTCCLQFSGCPGCPTFFLEVWTLRCFYIETKESLMVKSSEKCLETRDKSEESLLSRFVCASVDFQKSEFQPCRRNMCSTQTRNKQTTLPTPRKTNSANWKVSPIFFIGNKKQTRLKKKSRILEFSNESWFGFP